jgi:hypothetical protein
LTFDFLPDSPPGYHFGISERENYRVNRHETRNP